MKNREPSPGKAGRVSFTNEDNGEIVRGILAMDDDPIEEGTPLNKATLLTDETAAKFNLTTNNSTVNNAFGAISTKFDTVNTTFNTVNNSIAAINAKSTTTTITKTINIGNLQAELDALPKIINHTVTFNVNSGTYSGTITISAFSGTGSINIYGATSDSTYTHNVSNVIISGNTIRRMTIQGITATNTSGNSFYAEINSCYIYLNRCNSRSGSSSTTDLYGVNSYYNSGIVFASSCTMTNKYYAFYCAPGELQVASSIGTGNYTIYRVTAGGDLRVRDFGTITGTNIYSRGTGGTYTEPNGIHAYKWQTARTLSLTGDVSGSTSFDGSGNASISATVANNSHTHTIANVTNLQSALDARSTRQFATGYVSMIPTANTPTRVYVSYGQTFSGIPRVFVNPRTSVPGTVLLGANAVNATTTGFELYVTRTNNTETGLDWMAIY